MRRGLVLGCGGPVGFAWTAVALGLVEEALGWVTLLRRHGVRVIRIEPGPDELAAMGANFMDGSRRAATLAATREHLPARIHQELS